MFTLYEKKNNEKGQIMNNNKYITLLTDNKISLHNKTTTIFNR